MPSPAARVPLVLGISLLLSGCGADWDYRQAAFLEGSRRFPSAGTAWERFAAKHPGDPRAPEALVRAGRIYCGVFQRYDDARSLYERAARGYQDREPWASSARAALLDCPDYFPLKSGARPVFVDSMTGGKNMRLVLEVKASTDGARGTIAGGLYAGRERVMEQSRAYAKEDWAVWEMDGKNRVPILRYPYAQGMTWAATRDGRTIELRVESARETVKLRSRTYADCVKVRESAPGAKAWTYAYYAPGVGRIKTSIGVPGAENPNTELASP